LTASKKVPTAIAIAKTIKRIPVSRVEKNKLNIFFIILMFINRVCKFTKKCSLLIYINSKYLLNN